MAEIPSSHLESTFVPGEIPSNTPPDSQPSINPPTNQSGSSSIGVTPLKRRRSSGSNKEIATKPGSSHTSKRQPRLSIFDLPEIVMEVAKYPDIDTILAMRLVNKPMEPIFSERVPYIHIKKTEDLDLGLAFFRKTRNEEVAFEAEGIRCTAETFKKLFKEIKHLHLNGVSFTEADISEMNIPEECALAKFKSLHLSADLSWDAIAALLNKILPEELEALSLKFDGPLSAEQIARFPNFPKLKALVIDAPGLSGDAAVALLKKISPEVLETLSLKFYGQLNLEEIAEIARLPNFSALKKLVINNPSFCGDAVAVLLTNVSPAILETLSLRFDHLRSVEQIAQLPKFPALKNLELSSFGSSEITILTLLSTISPKNLETLNLNFNDSPSDDEIAGFSDLPAVKNLVIDACGLSGAAAVALLKKVSPEKLESLNARFSHQLNDDQIALFPDLPLVKNLAIDNNQLSGAAVVALINKALPENLDALGLSFDASLRAEEIEQFPDLPTLKELALDNGKFSGDTAVALFSKVSSENLQRLELRFDDLLSVEEINAFPNFTALKTLYTFGVEFSSDEVWQAFQQKFNPTGLVSIETEPFW